MPNHRNVYISLATSMSKTGKFQLTSLVQKAQPSSDCGKSNFPKVYVQGLSSIYSAPVVDCKIPAFIQQAQPSSDCEKSNFPTVDVRGLSSVYSAPVIDCKIPAFVQRWVYNRSNLLPTVEKVIFRQWIYEVYPVSIQPR